MKFRNTMLLFRNECSKFRNTTVLFRNAVLSFRNARSKFRKRITPHPANSPYAPLAHHLDIHVTLINRKKVVNVVSLGSTIFCICN
ncbi:hypothetical protein [Lentibacillus saliphilus]|uniref:hypothetical protein n=1 Tax=Lentibacillus saliphilus TaxID=2737028 RepID=UPI001C31046B|nr:hypothetical protein [Lentibacillus saliphilus]